ARAALDRFRTLAAWRREHVWPLAATPCLDATSHRLGSALIINWIFVGGTLSMALNPSDEPADMFCSVGSNPVGTGEFSHADDKLHLGPWTAVSWSTSSN